MFSTLKPFTIGSIAAIVSMWTLTLFTSIPQDVQLSVILLMSFGVGIIAYYISSVIQKRNYFKMTHDEETKAYNKQYFIDAANREISKSIRKQNTTFAIVFKLDKYEEIICTSRKSTKIIFEQIVSHLSRKIRNNDIFARLNDNAFIFLLSDETEKEHAMMLSERMQGVINSITCTDENNNTFQNLTATMLVEEYDMDYDMSVEDFISRLEEKLKNT